MFRSLRFISFVLSVILFFASGTASAEPEKLVLKQSADPVRLLLLSEDSNGCDILFELNELNKETIVVEKEVFQALTVSRGGLSGPEGHPALPTFSGMIAVPEGYSSRIEVISAEEKTLSEMRIFPVQPDKAETFVIDHSAYLTQGLSKEYTVDLGDPAIYLGQTVVPFTVHPIKYQPEIETITVATRLNLHFEFVADGKGLSSRRSFTTVPQSFTRNFDDAVINNPSSVKSGATGSGPGTYLVITPASGYNALTSLTNWRKRQGYNVIVTTTEEAGSSFINIKSYIQNIYDTVEPPLEYILLVGDANGSITCATGTEYLSGYSGETDHYYTTLDGSDYLSDVHIGRLTATDPTQLLSIVDKIVTYETNPPMTEDPDWFNRASLVGDPGESGITTIFVNQWLKAQLEAQAYTQVDTIFGGNFPALIHSSLNQGGSVFGYRGFYAMSNYSTGLIALLENGYELPLAVLPTCDTGSFRTHVTAHSEAFLRAPNGGSIGAIALSTVGTHTRYNNCLYQGIWEGLLNTSDHHSGSALTRGKLELFNNYHGHEENSAEIWACWSNLMGDPATDIWLDKPTTMDATHPTYLPAAAGSVPVTVTTEGQPVEGALVALYKTDELRVTGYTDAGGQVNLPISGHTSGIVLVTVTMHNKLPYRSWLSLDDVDVFAGLADLELSGGNGDGVVNPGETLDLRCSLSSDGSDMAPGVTASLISRNPLVTVLDGSEFFGDIPAGESIWCAESFQIEISPLVIDQEVVTLDLVATNGIDEWTSAVSLDIQSPEFSVVEPHWTGQGGDIGPGDHGTLVLDLNNGGSLAAGSVSAVLSTESPWILVTDEAGWFGALNPGETGNNTSNSFALHVSPDCFPGYLATFQLNLTLGDGLVRSTQFQMTVGHANSTDPVGPDTHGYYAFDNTDLTYDKAPTYQWTEINPDFGGPGTAVGLHDFIFENDETSTLDLPFSFQYYGESFDTISVCSNGWVAMGETTLKQYRNFTIPSAGSPNAMIAPFWDNLRQLNTNQICYYHDETEGTFTVEWRGVLNHYLGQQSFQVILRDPMVYPTSNGDGEILFQYGLVNNNDSVNGYATVGIQNLTGDDGLLYTYWNQYAAGAAPLEAGRAILFTPTPPILQATCETSPNSLIQVMAPNTELQKTLTIANNGEPGSELHYTIEKIDPDAPVKNDPAKNMEGSVMTASVATYPVHEVADIVFSVTNNSPDNEYLDSVSLDFPLGFTVAGATNLVHSGVQTLDFNGELGEGAHCTWDGGFITTGNTATCTVTVDFTESAGALVLPYVLFGDDYGGDPHSIEGTIVIAPSEASITLLSPNGGELWAVGDEVPISFLAGGGPEFLTVQLSRDQGEPETIMENVPVGETSVNWIVEGPLSAHCRIFVSDRDNPEILDFSQNEFTIGRDLGWVSLSQSSGSIASGSADEITVTINSTGLEPGDYAVDLIVQ